MLSVQNEQTKEKLELQKGDENEKTTEYKEPSDTKYGLICILATLIICIFGYFYNVSRISKELFCIISVVILIVVLSYYLGVFSNKKKTIDRVQNFLSTIISLSIVVFKGYTGELQGRFQILWSAAIMITVFAISALLRKIYEKFVKGANENE